MFWSRFEALCEAKGQKPNRVALELGISSASVTKWKNGTTPGYENLTKLASYFGVTTDWLTGKSQFRTQQELLHGLDSWCVAGTDDFDPAYDFCGLIKELRESRGISTEVLAAEIGLSAELYEQCEDGLDALTWEQAVKLSDYFSTTPKQLMFDAGCYVPEQPVPEDYRNNIDAFDALCEKAEAEAKENAQLEQAVESAMITKPYIKKITGRVMRLSEDEQKKAWEILKTVFGADDEQP